jgi:outer membrane protein assembly factor BamB
VDGVVYFEGGDGNLYAVNAADGAELWRFAYESSQLGFAPAPAVMDGVVYVVEGDGSLSAVNAADGTQHWKIDASMDASFESSPVVANGFVYVAVWRFGRAYLYALDAQSGAERWQYEQVARMKPAVADGVAYIMGQGVLHAFDARSGTERWNHEVTGVSGVDCLLVADGVVYLSFGRTLVAVDAKTRAEIWRHSTESDGTSYDVLPVVINGFVYFNGADGKLHALGAGSAKLSVGGAARVTEATSLRGGPSPTAVERAVLAPDTVVTLTNESKTVGNVVWWPVTVNETGSQGWVDGSKLEPLATG